MPETDSAAVRMPQSSDAEAKEMSAVSDPYIREQLEKRRKELSAALAAPVAAAPAASLIELLGEVDSALHRMDDGTYGICTECHDSVEKDRLLADPLVRLCLDHLTSDEQRALERDLELASRVQRGLLPRTDLRHGDWRVHYQYKPAGMVSGDYCDLIPPPAENGELVFLLGDVAGKGVAASLLMTHLHAMFRSLAGVGLTLDKLLEVANSVFCQSTIAGQYATLICGRAGQRGEIEIGSQPLHGAACAHGAWRQFTALHRRNFRSCECVRHRIRRCAAFECCGRAAWLGAAGTGGGVHEGCARVFQRQEAGG